jgi:type IV secretion system protein VirD4
MKTRLLLILAAAAIVAPALFVTSMMLPLIIRIGLVVLVLLVLALFARFTIFARDKVRRMYWRTRARMKPGPGFASIWEVQWHHSRWAAVLAGKRVRPSMGFWKRLTSRPTEYAIRHGRAQYGRRIYSSPEHQGVIITLPRAGKTAILGDRVIDHPGPALVAESRSDMYYATRGYREARGPSEVFNPVGVGSIPSTFGWAITQGCRNPAEAIRRAGDLVDSVAAGEMVWWSEKSTTALAAAMHAADVAGADMGDVWAWSNGYAPELITEGTKAGADRMIINTLAELDKPTKTADSIRITMSKSLAWLAVPAIRNMVTGPQAHPFDVQQFVRSNGTIYLMSGGDGDPCAPLFRCFTGYVHRAAGLYGLSLPARKLDPGLLIAIDELHACPVDLPSWLADSAGKGIQVVAVVHSTGQLITKYEESGFRTVWDTTGTKLFLPGIQDTETLENISKLCGWQDDDRLHPKVPAEYLRQIPDGWCMLMRTNRPPVMVRFRPYWKRHDTPKRPPMPPAPVIEMPKRPPMPGTKAPEIEGGDGLLA